MSFLDPKERVIDLQLTSYGKYLLSVGRFKPVEYAFFDSDIIYDRRFAQSGTEPQSEIEGRIQENTPRLATQTIYRSAEVGVFATNENLKYNLMPGVLADKANKVSQTPDKSYIFQEPIGNSAYNSNNVAAWNIGFLKAELTSSVSVLTSSCTPTSCPWAGPTLFIPQLSCSLQYYIETYEPNIQQQNSDKYSGVDVAEDTVYDINTPVMFQDESYMIYKDDFVLLKIEEANTEFLKENFELEVYKIEPIEGTKKNADGETVPTWSDSLVPLYFEGDNDNIDKTSRVDYYFNVDIDFEISEEEYCKLVKAQGTQQDKIKNIYNDKIFNCESRKETLRSLNIYATNENQDPGDICE
jgi:hypothetical protein